MCCCVVSLRAESQRLVKVIFTYLAQSLTQTSKQEFWLELHYKVCLCVSSVTENDYSNQNTVLDCFEIIISSIPLGKIITTTVFLRGYKNVLTTEFLPHCYVVARVFWVVARWFFSAIFDMSLLICICGIFSFVFWFSGWKWCIWSASKVTAQLSSHDSRNHSCLENKHCSKILRL